MLGFSFVQHRNQGLGVSALLILRKLPLARLRSCYHCLPFGQYPFACTLDMLLCRPILLRLLPCTVQFRPCQKHGNPLLLLLCFVFHGQMQEAPRCAYTVIPTARFAGKLLLTGQN